MVQGECGLDQSHRDAQATVMTRLPAHACVGWPLAEQTPQDKHPICSQHRWTNGSTTATSLTALWAATTMKGTSVPN